MHLVAVLLAIYFGSSPKRTPKDGLGVEEDADFTLSWSSAYSTVVLGSAFVEVFEEVGCLILVLDSSLRPAAAAGVYRVPEGGSAWHDCAASAFAATATSPVAHEEFE